MKAGVEHSRYGGIALFTVDYLFNTPSYVCLTVTHHRHNLIVLVCARGANNTSILSFLLLINSDSGNLYLFFFSYLSATLVIRKEVYQEICLAKLPC